MASSPKIADKGECPIALCGVWKQQMSSCESMCPFLAGLGMPNALQYVACPLVDTLKTTLRISCPDPGVLEIVDKTAFGRNATVVATDGTEVEKLTRNGRKTYMLSATTATATESTLTCRLTSRGPGWYTRQERSLSPDGQSLVERNVLVRPGSDDVVVTRHFVRANDEDLRPKPKEAKAKSL